MLSPMLDTTFITVFGSYWWTANASLVFLLVIFLIIFTVVCCCATMYTLLVLYQKFRERRERALAAQAEKRRLEDERLFKDLEAQREEAKREEEIEKAREKRLQEIAKQLEGAIDSDAAKAALTVVKREGEDENAGNSLESGQEVEGVKMVLPTEEDKAEAKKKMGRRGSVESVGGKSDGGKDGAKKDGAEDAKKGNATEKKGNEVGKGKGEKLDAKSLKSMARAEGGSLDPGKKK